MDPGGQSAGVVVHYRRHEIQWRVSDRPASRSRSSFSRPDSISPPTTRRRSPLARMPGTTRGGRTQPLGEPSAGCVFKNPPGHHASRLIDSAGLQGQAARRRDGVTGPCQLHRERGRRDLRGGHALDRPGARASRSACMASSSSSRSSWSGSAREDEPMGRIFGHRRKSSRVPVTRRADRLSIRDLAMGQGAAGWRSRPPRRAVCPSSVARFGGFGSPRTGSTGVASAPARAPGGRRSGANSCSWSRTRRARRGRVPRHFGGRAGGRIPLLEVQGVQVARNTYVSRKRSSPSSVISRGESASRGCRRDSRAALARPSAAPDGARPARAESPADGRGRGARPVASSSAGTLVEVDRDGLCVAPVARGALPDLPVLTGVTGRLPAPGTRLRSPASRSGAPTPRWARERGSGVPGHDFARSTSARARFVASIWWSRAGGRGPCRARSTPAKLPVCASVLDDLDRRGRQQVEVDLRFEGQLVVRDLPASS